MFLDASKVPELNRLFSSGRYESVGKIHGAEISLTVSLFLSLLHRECRSTGKIELGRALSDSGLAGVERGIFCLDQNGEQFSPDPFGAPKFELYRIFSQADLLSEEWILFCDRFRRSAANGRKSTGVRLTERCGCERGVI